MANEEINRLKVQNRELQAENTILRSDIVKMQHEHKADMESLRNNVVAINNQQSVGLEVDAQGVYHSKK
ncbi:MAG: hypothetical protein IJO43_00350 [Bacilli bacterium]|nr:hypothetical protein [Bacilli bacterium]